MFYSVPKQAVHAYERLASDKVGAAEEAYYYDRQFDGGEFCGPEHAERMVWLERYCLEVVAGRYGISPEDLRDTFEAKHDEEIGYELHALDYRR